MPATTEETPDGPESDRHEEIQAAVDQLAARLDLSVLIEDHRQRPLCACPIIAATVVSSLVG